MNPTDIFNKILDKEGGYINHPLDRGGATCWGITEKVARSHGYTGPMQLLPRETALTILNTDYWIKPGFNKIAEISPVIARKLCDAGVNVGPATVINWLQRWLNVFSQQGKQYAPVSPDGKTGAQTLKALNDFLAMKEMENEKVMVKALNCSQGNHYLTLAEAHPTDQIFIYGWISKRIAF